MSALDDAAVTCGVSTTELTLWIERRWILPLRQDSDYVFGEADLARAGMIAELRRDMGIDDEAMRLAYRLIETPLPITHHNGSAQVVPDGAGGCRFVWITDVQPDPLAEYIAPLMAQGIAVIKETMERAATPA